MARRYPPLVSRHARLFLGLLLAATFAGTAPQVAVASVAAPVIVPTPDSDGIPNATMVPACTPRVPGNVNWTTCLLPDKDASVDWPSTFSEVWPAPRSFILSQPGLYAIWLGETRTEIGRPLIWYDVGSGLPVAPASGPYQFPLAGKYAWECLTCAGVERTKLQGTMYVIGPRATISYKLVSADNSGSNITYGFDASGSFVTDYTPHSIVQYSFDFEDDGVFDQTSPEPTAQAVFAPGPHTVRIRVKDDLGRVGEYPLFFEIPYARPPNPESTVVTDTTLGNINSGVKFSTTKIKIAASKKVKAAVLRVRGLSVKISGLTKGDRVKVRLLKGRKSVAAGRGTATGKTKTVRLRVGPAGKRILAARPRVKRLVIDVGVEGTDGYTATKRVAVRIS